MQLGYYLPAATRDPAVFGRSAVGTRVLDCECRMGAAIAHGPWFISALPEFVTSQA